MLSWRDQPPEFGRLPHSLKGRILRRILFQPGLPANRSFQRPQRIQVLSTGEFYYGPRALRAAAAVVESLVMSSQAKPQFTPEEYLAMERGSEQRHEYFDGEIFLMSGASESHNLIAVNISREISIQFKGRPCRVYSADMRIRVATTGLYTYPDIVAVCGQPALEDQQLDTLLNPTLVIEILSPSTEAYDRGRTFEHYRNIDSLAEYLLVSQDNAHVEHFVRQPGGQWLFSEVTGLERSVDLPSVACRLQLAEIYDKVELDRRTT